MKSDLRSRPDLPGDLIRRAAREAGEKAVVCRFCGKAIAGRLSWHKRCVRVYAAAVFRSDTIDWLLRRQQGRCASCPTVLGVYSRVRGQKRPGWYDVVRVEIDHVIPLWLVALMPAERRTIRWWLPGNLQALCGACHEAKTTGEASERAAARRRKSA